MQEQIEQYLLESSFVEEKLSNFCLILEHDFKLVMFAERLGHLDDISNRVVQRCLA